MKPMYLHNSSCGQPARTRALPVIQVAETPRYIHDHDAPRQRIGARHNVLQ